MGRSTHVASYKPYSALLHCKAGSRSLRLAEIQVVGIVVLNRISPGTQLCNPTSACPHYSSESQLIIGQLSNLTYN